MTHVHVVKTIAPQVTIQERVIGDHGRPQHDVLLKSLDRTRHV